MSLCSPMLDLWFSIVQCVGFKVFVIGADSFTCTERKSVANVLKYHIITPLKKKCVFSVKCKNIVNNCIW